LLISADYKQQEVRLMAHLAGDEKLCRVLRQRGDPFRRIAAMWYGIQEDKVGAINFLCMGRVGVAAWVED